MEKTFEWGDENEMTNRETVQNICGRAEGVIAVFYGLIRDTMIGSVEEDRDGKLGNVVGDIFQALEELPELVKPENESVYDALATINCFLKNHPEAYLQESTVYPGKEKSYELKIGF